MKVATIFQWCICAVIISSSVSHVSACSQRNLENVEKYLHLIKHQIVKKFRAIVVLTENADSRLNSEEWKVIDFSLSETENLINEFESCLFYFLYQELKKTHKFISPDHSTVLNPQKAINQQSMTSDSSKVPVIPDGNLLSPDEKKIQANDTFQSEVGIVVDHVLDTGSGDFVQNAVEEILDLSFQKRLGEDPFNKDTQKQSFPTYTSIPYTGFTCDDKKYIPGFYADVATDCQVFHVCWPRRRESYLCPVGTIFNQKTLICDEFYISNCSASPRYYYYNEGLLALNNPEQFAMDDSIYSEMTNPGYHIQLYSNTLSLPPEITRIITAPYPPIEYQTTYYPNRLLHPDTPLFEEFDAQFPPHGKDGNYSSQEVQALSYLIYYVVYGGDLWKKAIESVEKPTTESVNSEDSWNVDRSGDLESEHRSSENKFTGKTVDSPTASVKKASRKRFKKVKSNSSSERKVKFGPSEPLDTPEKVDKGIKYLTRIIMGLNYVKIMKNKD